VPAPEISRRRPRRDLWLVLASTLVCYGLSLHFELHERYYGWLARYERWQVDELPLALLVLACGMAWYAFRRRAEAQQALAQRELAQAEASALLARNRQLAQGLLALQENERRSLARELHDEMGQRCTALRMETAFLRRCEPTDTAGMLAAADRADIAAQSVYQLVRDLLRRLRPAHLDTLGLVASLQDLCEGWEQRSGVICVFHHAGTDPGFDDEVAVAVYRVAQEALTNVMRHAQASRVRVQLARGSEGAVRLIVQDDGQGAGPSPTGRGLGLLGASERALSLGGHLSVRGEPGQGTTLELWLPAPAPAAARRMPRTPLPETESA
jgi:two-component system sensor histidine kinase UhpB